jgi:adenylosuccinate lyase
VFSQPVLLALVRAGKTRDEAYRIVQRHAMTAWDESCDFRTLLEADPQVSVESLDDAFNLSGSLRHLDIVFDALERIAL